ncbi:Fur-regulated basic protein FbpA [Peribacillus kribbensis]|uniref:Fur-regulated basic protein FbpA n=1 Tax=Peribacillus kribbensis TaxID=356658 RepID=UPI0004179519|nr:Fur-regulated basic protein FbpA [Peribacillus kribbensis]
MGSNRTIEGRRNELIHKLIEFEQFKKDGKQLFELTLNELKNEYLKLQANFHPHSGFESIRWKKF